MKRIEMASGKTVVNLYASPCDVLVRLPLVHDFLLNEEHEDLTPRRPGVLIIKAENQAYQVYAKEPSSAVMLRYTAGSVMDIFTTLESLLAAPVVPWAHDPAEAVRTGKNKK